MVAIPRRAQAERKSRWLDFRVILWHKNTRVYPNRFLALSFKQGASVGNEDSGLWK
jgi:hypothetical protein